MTTAVFVKKKNRYEINISGHAGYNPGNDIVCSACSTLAYTLLQCLMELEEKGAINEFSQKVDENTGALLVKLKTAKWANVQVEATIDTILKGYALLNDRYPSNVNLITKISGEK